MESKEILRKTIRREQRYAEMALESAPHLRQIYNDETGNKMMMFHLEDATAYDIEVMGEGVDLME